MEEHCLKSDEGNAAGLTISDIRIWVQRIHSSSRKYSASSADSADKERMDVNRGIVPVLPYYQSRAIALTPGRFWQLINPVEYVQPIDLM